MAPWMYPTWWSLLFRLHSPMIAPWNSTSLNIWGSGVLERGRGVVTYELCSHVETSFLLALSTFLMLRFLQRCSWCCRWLCVPYVLQWDEDPMANILQSKWAGKLPLLFHPYIKRGGGHFFYLQRICSILKKATWGAQLPISVSSLHFAPLALPLTLFFLYFQSFRMGRFASLVDTPEKREAFKAKYHIPIEVTIDIASLGTNMPKDPRGK